MLRSVAVITAAIALVAPHVPEKTAVGYARVLRAEAHRHGFDPFTGVAIIWHEADWRPGAVSKNGEDHGLGQIRARFIGACKHDPDPVHHPSPACARVKASLLEPHNGIRMMGKAIANWRKTCRTLTGRRALFHRWLAGYGGFGNLKKGRICGQLKRKGKWRDHPRPKQVSAIIQCRRNLLRSRPCKRRLK